MTPKAIEPDTTTKIYKTTNTFDDKRWNKLQAFYKLPWYKRIFRKLP